MAADAIVAFHPKNPELLKPFLDLDDVASEDDDDERHYAEPLDDGTMLVHTFQPFELFAQNPDEALEWLSQFGDVLPELHDDPRGFLFYPDSLEPAATSYEALVTEIAEEGFFVDPDGEELDLGAFQAMAEQMLGGAQGVAPNGSFEMGKLLQDMQQQLAGAFGLEPVDPGSPVIDAEFEASDDEPAKK